MKILNLYAGIGGNRAAWPVDSEVTAVEYDREIAEVYKSLFPQDQIIIGDAHNYLLEHYSEFDFIWSSPPCPTHSRMRRVKAPPKYPDMRLYAEIIFLQRYFKGKWCVENVVSYYKPLIKPKWISDQYFWSNFHIEKFRDDRKTLVKHGESILNLDIKTIQEYIGINLDNFKVKNKRLLLNNAVYPKLGSHILNCAFKNVQMKL